MVYCGGSNVEVMCCVFDVSDELATPFNGSSVCVLVPSKVGGATDNGHSSYRGYDGLGGNTKVDDFPRPLPVRIKKRQVAPPTRPALKPTKIRILNGTKSRDVQLTNFWKNTFSD